MNLRAALLTVAVFVPIAGLATLAGVLAALPFHGATRYVVWAVAGTEVTVGATYLLDRTAEKKGWL